MLDLHATNFLPKFFYKLMYHDSKYTNTKFLKNFLKIEFIKLWNVDGALVRPNGINKNS